MLETRSRRLSSGGPLLAGRISPEDAEWPVRNGMTWDRAPQSWGRGLILIAGGDETSREWTRETLQIEGYAALVADNAVRFMELMVRYRAIVRLIVCGAVLEGNRCQNLVQLVRDNLKGDVPVVVMDDGMNLPGRYTGTSRPDALLTMPRNAAQLVATVDEVVMRRSQTVSEEQTSLAPS